MTKVLLALLALLTLLALAAAGPQLDVKEKEKATAHENNKKRAGENAKNGGGNPRRYEEVSSKRLNPIDPHFVPHDLLPSLISPVCVSGQKKPFAKKPDDQRLGKEPLQ